MSFMANPAIGANTEMKDDLPSHVAWLIIRSERGGNVCYSTTSLTSTLPVFLGGKMPDLVMASSRKGSLAG
jgi:hypothetical protein